MPDKRSFIIAMATGLAACAGERQRPAAYTLEEVARHGSTAVFDLEDSAAAAPSGGALLADIAGIVRTADTTLYVLDRDYKKLVAFRHDGNEPKVILGGVGDGPGEFRLPVHVTATEYGILSVLDYEASRITYFGPEGVAGIVALNRPSLRKHAILGDSIFITRFPFGGLSDPIADIYSTSGESLGVGPPQSDIDQPFGSPAGISVVAGGGVLISTTRPGVWMELRDHTWRRVGTPLFPEMEPPHEELLSTGVTRVTPAQATAASIGQLGDSIVIQGWNMLPEPFDWEDPPEMNEYTGWLGLFSPEGDHLGSVQLPDGVSTHCMYVDNLLGRILLCATDPVPQVVEYVLRR